MKKIKFSNFTKPWLLKRIDRNLLTKLFEQFHGLALPPPTISDEEFSHAVSRMLMNPEDLPEPLTEALFAIDEMSCPNAMAMLEGAEEWKELRGKIAAHSTPHEIALQVWLIAPEVLARIHNRERLRRLTMFEYFSSSCSSSSSSSKILDDVSLLTSALDAWFSLNHRGHQTTRIEMYAIDCEFWFLVRHGDIFTRTPKVEAQKTEILHFRPERDDVIVFSPEHDEIRINARTKGERELYRREFGRHLRGSADYFSRRNHYTLEPLRLDGPQALHTTEIPELKKITLHELEIAFDNGNHEVLTTASDDLFARSGPYASNACPIPRHGRLTRAIFRIQLAGRTPARVVELRPPNILKVSRRCDAGLVQKWLRYRGFRVR